MLTALYKNHFLLYQDYIRDSYEWLSLVFPSLLFFMLYQIHISNHTSIDISRFNMATHFSIFYLLF